jgi:23S rRNA (cytosine1962-C5)-methyltransferase
MQLETLVAEPWPDWGLIDSGDGRKLERYGKIKVVRPEPQAMWAPASPEWDDDATFVPGSDEEGGGRWVQHRPVPREWELSRGPVRFKASQTPIPHHGLFPDKSPHWDLMRERAEDSHLLNQLG